MDIQSKEKVEEALEEFQGSIIFVSHDRYFINRLASRIFLIEDKKIRIFEGNYDHYLSKSIKEKADKEKEKQLRDIMETIMKLEVELAYLGGKLDQTQDEEEKEELNRQYLEVARTLKKKSSRCESLKNTKGDKENCPLKTILNYMDNTVPSSSCTSTNPVDLHIRKQLTSFLISL